MTEAADRSASPFVARLRDVSLIYGKVRAIDRVNLDVPAGRIVGLIGPDGVGKSSLLSLISGARALQEGTVEVLGGSMAQAFHRRDVCPRIAYMPQGLGKNLYPTLSISENLEFFGRLFGQDRAERERRSGHHMLAHRRVEAYRHATLPAYPAGAAQSGPITIEGNEARTNEAKKRL